MIPLAALVLLFLFVGVVAVIITVIVLIIRSVARRGAMVTPRGQRPPVNVATQVGPDGFWLSSFEPGSVIYYQYWAGATKRQGQSVFQPGNDGRQFVYTGMQPSDVEIVRVVDQLGGVVSGPVYYGDDTPDIVPPIIEAAAAQAVADALANVQPRPPAPPPWPQFPSAY